MHPPGEDRDTPETLRQLASDGARSATGVVRSLSAMLAPILDAAAREPAPPAPTTPATTTVDPAITRWAGRTPASNPDIATWLLEGIDHGFLTAPDPQKAQLAAIGAGTPIHNTRGAKEAMPIAAGTDDPVLGLLEILEALVRKRADRWLQTPSASKKPLAAGDMIRDIRDPTMADAHRTGQSLDAGQNIDWADPGPGAARAVIAILEDLPIARWRIGLPHQGQFFRLDDTLARRKRLSREAAEAAGAAEPEPITAPSLVLGSTHTHTAAWNARRGEWVPQVSGWNRAVGHLVSDELRRAITRLNQGGQHIEIMLDWPDHIHLTRL